MEGRHGRPLRKRIGNYRNYGGERWVSKHLWRESSTIPRRRPTETFTGLPTCSTRVKAPSSNGRGILWSAKSRRSSMIIGRAINFLLRSFQSSQRWESAAWVTKVTAAPAGSIYLFGDEEQKERWLATVMGFGKDGAVWLDGPLVGFAASGGVTTTCRRESDAWVLNGEKKWIGNATFADINVIWAREETSNQVKGFIVGKDNPGFSVKKIENKMALRVVQNGLITLKDCRVPERD